MRSLAVRYLLQGVSIGQMDGSLPASPAISREGGHAGAASASRPRASEIDKAAAGRGRFAAAERPDDDASLPRLCRARARDEPRVRDFTDA